MGLFSSGNRKKVESFSTIPDALLSLLTVQTPDTLYHNSVLVVVIQNASTGTIAPSFDIITKWSCFIISFERIWIAFDIIQQVLIELTRRSFNQNLAILEQDTQVTKQMKAVNN